MSYFRRDSSHRRGNHRLSGRQSMTYQTAINLQGQLQSQTSCSPYGELKPDLSEQGEFRTRMCMISAICFVASLVWISCLMTYLLWPTAPPSDLWTNEFFRCHRPQDTETVMTSGVMKSYPVEVQDEQAKKFLTCSKLTKDDIKSSVAEDCDKNSDDDLRVYLSSSSPDKNDESLLKQWGVALNRSSVSLDTDGRFSVKYSGVYIVQSSLAFECKSVSLSDIRGDTYWQEIQVANVTYFRDEQKITTDTVSFKPAFCYRSFLYGLLWLRANENFRIKAGPPGLLYAKREMSYLTLYRP